MMIVLSGLPFLFRFLPVFLIIYYICPVRYRNSVLFIGSVFFYATGEPYFLLLLLGAVVFNYFIGRLIWRKPGAPRLGNAYAGLIAGVAVDVLILAVCKVLALRSGTFAIPLGLSFYIFKMISYQADLFLGKIPEKPEFIDTAAYFTMFPQVTQGPIMRFGDAFGSAPARREMPEAEDDTQAEEDAQDDSPSKRERTETEVSAHALRARIRRMEERASAAKGADRTDGKQVSSASSSRSHRDTIRKTDRRVTPTDFERGLVLLAAGLSFKVLIADRIGILWHEIGTIGYESISTPLAWLGAYAYSLQLYFDFFGYSLIAGGVGVMLGFPMVVNFNDPYRAKGIADFYRRWHITLGAWFRDYVYIPLGGSRKGPAVTVINLLIVWLLTGLWHGGTLNFVIWGLVLGLFIISERFLVSGVMEKSAVLGRIHVWLVIPLTWVVFAISDLEQLKVYFCRLFPFFGVGSTLNPGDFLKYLQIYWPFFLIGILLSVTGAVKFLLMHRRNVLVTLLLTAAFWGSVYMLVTTQGNAFMYFSF